MLLNRPTLDGIAAGRITLVFRRWRRPSVRAGGTLLTSIGLLAIEDVEPVAEIGEDEAKAAGYGSQERLLAELAERQGQLYRVRLRLSGPDPRIALGATAELEKLDLAVLSRRLKRLDSTKPWTIETLSMIAANPGRRARDLAARLGRERLSFKQHVRKLKKLGLAESLATGYRLSPRGDALLRLMTSSQ
ncbi:hypothetical protein FG93_01745 [Bosea sp. LC85]|uniref:hypothetical protein n=1 Tax=Bosea sp. LC85 TaxID=1502851 RepID=UPI0004E37344|nr:hypothetical protein [Bosea sp. LC85]KFC73377.1 hypothetical protein FG93_01745 [Bosea sp. LC85]